jgi:thiol-disulfide isomerase/thioredoxin
VLTIALSFALACDRRSDVASIPAGAPPARDEQARHAASITFVSLDELQAELAKLRGRGVLLNFWAIWCAPCVAELPSLVATVHDYESRGGAALLVSYDLMVPGADRTAVRAQMETFLAKKKIDVPVLIYDASDYDAINAKFGLPGEVPVTLAFDRNGKLVDRQSGGADKPRFAEMMQRALAP